MTRLLNQVGAASVRTVPTAPPEVWLLPVHGERILFDANSLCAVQLGDGVLPSSLAGAGDQAAETLLDAAALASLGSAQLDSLIEGGALFGRCKPQFQLAAAMGVRRVVLNVTHSCNLACRYCFVDRSERQRLSFEAAMKGISLIERGQPLDVAFFGGEPLLEWEIIERITEATEELARRRRVRCKFHITTNGTLLDEEKAAFLRVHGCSVLLSLDGPGEIHDLARPFRAQAPDDSPGGDSSFDRTMAGLAALNAAGIRPMCRATFQSCQPRLRERLEFFAALQDAGRIGGFSIEPAILSEGCAARPGQSQEPDPTELRSLAAEYHEAARWFVGRLRDGRSVGFFHFRKMLDRILRRLHAGTECGAGKGYITIGPDGAIHACHRERTPIGHVEYGFDEDARAAWMENRIYGRPGCMPGPEGPTTGCWARYLCGGGCREACLAVSGDLRGRNRQRCEIQKIIVRECLWILTQAGQEAAAIAAGGSCGTPPARSHGPREQ